VSEPRSALEGKVVEAALGARDEEKLQGLLAARLAKIGAQPDLWEPAPTGAGSRFLPAGLDFVGRPQLAAVLPGAGGGRSMLLNGHIDAVDVAPREQWLSDPFKVEERDGSLYGRGVSDMKGGIVAESTEFDAWVSCRGTVTPTITVEGHAGHAEIPQPDWREGGAVNAIEKLVPLLNGIPALREEWRTRPDHRHPLLAPGDIVPTVVGGGTWMVMIPSSCDVTCDITYLPGHADAEGTGKAVEAEVVDRLTAAAAGDPWFAEHPLRFTWTEDVAPAEMPPDHPLVVTALECAALVGRSGKPAGFDSWHDAATFTAGGTPTFSFGPDGIETAHAVNERASVQSFLDFTAAVAVMAMRWCDVA